MVHLTEEKNMNTFDKGAQEAKKLNAQVKSGNASSFTSTTDYNSPELQEARQLNSQAGSSSSSYTGNTTANMAGMTSSSNNADLEEAKKLNQQSRQNKSK
jgi:hypothetical protein